MVGPNVLSGSEGAAGLRLASSKGRWVIAATVLGSGMVAIDATVVGIAIPAIGRDFQAPLGPLQWVSTGYTLTLAAFLLLGGSLGDRFGRRRVFMIGVAWFAVASALCTVAPDTTTLILTRALQGIGGALLTPGSLAIIQASFAVNDRPRAIGMWSGLGGLATAAGPLVGGYLISAVSWRLIFLINVPLAAIVLTLSARHVPESRDTSARSTDVPGAILAVILLGGINYTLIQGASIGWSSPGVLTSAAVSVVAAVSFFLVERSRTSPMLPFKLFKNRQFSATNLVTFTVYGALGAVLFLLPIVLQVVSHYSPLESGISLLPVTIIMLVFSARSGRLAGRIGPRLQMSLGPIVVGVGILLLYRTTGGTGYFAYVFPAVAVFGTGLAITVAPLTSTAMESVPAQHSGLASAINNDVARIASLVAVAILPWLSGIPANALDHASVLSTGFKSAALIAAVVCAAGGVLALFTIRNPPRKSDAGRDHPTNCALDAPSLVSAESGTDSA
jgi:EmrB/QacA subfamily drug resistance transporter